MEQPSTSSFAVISMVITALTGTACQTRAVETPHRPSELTTAIDRTPAAIFQGLLTWQGPASPAANLAASGRPPHQIHTGPIKVVPGTGLTDEQIHARIDAALASVASEPGRFAEGPTAGRQLRAGGGGRQYLSNPVVVDDIAFVDSALPLTAIVTYVLAWRNGRWVPMATLLGPVI